MRSEGLLASGRQMLAHFRNGQLVATYAVGFGVLFNFICTFTFVSFHLAAAPYNLSASALGAIFVVYLVGSVLTPWIGWAVGRFGRRRFTVRVIALWIAGIALTLAPSLPLIILGLAISAGCGLICQAISTGYVTITAKAGRSSAVGLYVTSFYIGGSFGAAVGGLAWTLGALAGLRRAGGGDAAGDGGASCISPGPAACRPNRPCRRSSRREIQLALAMPERPVAAREHGKDRGRRQHVDMRRTRGAACGSGIAARRPAQKAPATHGEWPRRQARYIAPSGSASIVRRCRRLALPARRSACRTSSIAGAAARFGLPENSKANCFASWRRHSKQGR